jgi:tetratricopeptide (TPR) repeat protein
MHRDALGNSISTSNLEAVHHLEYALDCFLHFRGDLLGGVQNALQSDPNFALARAFNAYVGVLSTEPNEAARAALEFHRWREATQRSNWLERERWHLEAAQQLLRGDWHGAGRTLEVITASHPRDLLALAVGHQIDFFTGNSRLLRDRPAQVLHAWTPEEANYGNLLGMLSFGLGEMHQHDRGLELGFEAVERNPSDVWALHAVGHHFEETGRFDDGRRYYDARLEHWTNNNYFLVHNWWHYALFTLESGDIARTLEIFDSALFTSQTGDFALQLLDATALLWRLKLEGFAEYERFTALATRWESKLESPFYAFNDMHAMMALLGAKRFEDGQRLLEHRERYLLEAAHETTNRAMTRDIGLPVLRGLLAFALEAYDQAVEHLMPIHHRLHEFGGSHAQRDVMLKTLIEAALRSNQFDLAQTLLSERIALRPRSPYNWQKYASALEGIGEHTQAALARAKAKARLELT